MFGKEYIAPHVRLVYAYEQKDAAWPLYVAETLRCISESAAKLGGPYMQAKWADILNPKPEETRSPEEVIRHVKDRLAEL